MNGDIKKFSSKHSKDSLANQPKIIEYKFQPLKTIRDVSGTKSIIYDVASVGKIVNG